MKINELNRKIYAFDIVQLICQLRSDINTLLIQSIEKGTEDFLHWLLYSGLGEYQTLVEDKQFTSFLSQFDKITQLSQLQLLVYLVRQDVQLIFHLPEKRDEFLHWFYQSAIIEYPLYKILPSKEKKLVSKQYREKINSERKSIIPAPLLFGVNLIGYAYGQLGIGEDLRMSAKTLKAVNMPFSIINFPPSDDIPQNELSMLPYVEDNPPYAINIFCLTAMEHGRFYAEKGKELIQDRYNIGYWPWELSQWPKDWQILELTSLVDEVWVSTRHTYDALAPVSSVPVLIMPMTVELGEISHKTRKDFNLPEQATLFYFSFDLNSSIHRKNPQACVDSFLNAFPLNQQNNPSPVGLVIKVHPPKHTYPEWDKLKTLAKNDPRIHIIEATLSRPDLLALYQCCDCFLSLHRAEGFGRGIAEAMQLGLHIITTAYSGNLDFCQNQTLQVDLVDYKLIPIKEGEYPYADQQVWADVKINYVVQLMQGFVHKGQYQRHLYPKNFPNFSADVVGERYNQRLNFIKNNLLKKSNK